MKMLPMGSPDRRLENGGEQAFCIFCFYGFSGDSIYRIER
jgi:hypothetical protein